MRRVIEGHIFYVSISNKINPLIVIGPRSDHSLLMSVTNWLTHWLTDKLVEDWINKPKYAEYADYAD